MKLAPLILSLFVLPALVPSASAGTLYRWTDADGRVHYSDLPPPAGIRGATLKSYQSGAREGAVSPEVQPAKLKSPVTLYTTATCGVPCERAKAHLARRGIRYISKDPSVSVDANEELRKGGGQARVPTLMIGSEKLEGYDEAAWDAALNQAGHPPAGSERDPSAAPSKP